MKGGSFVLVSLGIAAIGVFLLNASFLARPTSSLEVLAHRGVHQQFHPEGVGNDTCTAAQSLPPTHRLLENTLSSARAAFEAGADIVEIDVHPTTDGDFAVFHDWTLDCRTDGHGVTREHSMAELRALDIGHGYTADGGRTFPFRGSGVGLMPSLRDVIAAFPNQRLLINFKSRTLSEGDAMVAYLEATPGARPERLTFYGSDPAFRLRQLRPGWRVVTEGGLKACAKGYMLSGWLGLVPRECHNTIIFVPVNYAAFAWGWPNRLLVRMRSVGSEVFLTAPVLFGARPVFSGINDEAGLAEVPRDWHGGLSTDAIEVVGPLVEGRRRRAPAAVQSGN